jgi:hypothetical protein
VVLLVDSLARRKTTVSSGPLAELLPGVLRRNSSRRRNITVLVVVVLVVTHSAWQVRFSARSKFLAEML